MPPSPEPKQKPPVTPAVDNGLFPPHAYEFIQEGLDFTVQHLHGPHAPAKGENRHVSGQQLCEGLRELALAKWGRMARTVLRRWNLCCTFDFGRLVFSLIDKGQMQKVEEDTIEDFKNVYDFKTAFESDYRIPSQP
jgi:uncharacterized repeat protein (TIGR04138 family)